MGCVVTRSTHPHIISANLKLPLQHRPISECQTESAADSTQKLVSEHPTSEQQASQSGTPHGSPSQGFLKQFRTLKSINSGSKKLDPFPKLILPSNNASLQELSFKGASLEASFAHEGNPNLQTAGPSPSEKNHLKTDLQNLRVMKESTPCFAKPSSFRSLTPSLYNNNPETTPQEREGNQWSFGPLKESHISLAPSAEIPDSKASFRERKASEDKTASEKSGLIKVSPPLENSSLIIDDQGIKKEEAEQKVGLQENLTEQLKTVKEKSETIRIPITVEKSSLVLEDKEIKKPEVETTAPALKLRNKNQKFQNILLSDAVAGTPSTFGINEPRNPVRVNNFDHRLVEASPPKTLTIFDVPVTTDSITKKSLELPDHTIITGSTTNACSIATISNLISLCKDVKKKDFEKKFRTNLVDLIKERSNEADSDPKRKNGEKKRASILIKNGRRFSGTNGSTAGNGNKLSSSNLLSKSSFSNNLLNMKEEENKTPPAHGGRNKSVQINNEDVFGDLAVPSPITKPDERMLSKYHIPRLAQFNTSVSKYCENSMQQEKSINFEEGMSRMDWDKYSIYEHINNVEIDDRSLSQTHLEASLNLEAINNTQLNTSVIGTEILEGKDENNTSTNLLKSKSVPYQDKGEDIENFSAHKSTPYQTSHKTININDTISTLQYLSPQQAPRTLAASGRKRMMAYSRADSQVVETNRVDVSVDDEGQKKINQYIMVKEIGRGGFGKVKLSFNVETKTQNAIKIANKKKLKKKLLTRQKSAYTQLASEIAIMKKLDHPNIVRLFEVIDCPSNDKLYLVMEYVKRGSVMSKGFWRQATKAKGLGIVDESEGPFVRKKNILSEEKAKKYFRDLVLGLDFLHNYAQIVHRDIKPENLLIGEDDTLKISDFGISQIMQGDDLLENNVGTKYYLAPEAWEGKSYHGKPTDIWAAGGTLFYFLVGKPPFDGINPQDIQEKIKSGEPNYPQELNPKAIELIKGCLKKDPNERLTIEQIMQDPWLTNDGQDPLNNEEFEQVEVTEEELSKALTKIKFMAAIRVMAKLKKTLTISRRNIERRKTTDEVGKKKQMFQAQNRKSEYITTNSRDER